MKMRTNGNVDRFTGVRSPMVTVGPMLPVQFVAASPWCEDDDIAALFWCLLIKKKTLRHDREMRARLSFFFPCKRS